MCLKELSRVSKWLKELKNPFLNMTQRIELLSIWLKELNMTQIIELFFLIWLKKIDLSRWLKELKFFDHMTQRIEPFSAWFTELNRSFPRDL